MILAPVRMLVKLQSSELEMIRPLHHRDVISMGRLMINGDEDCLLLHHDP